MKNYSFLCKDALVLWQQLRNEMLRILDKLLRLNLVILVEVKLSEDCIDVLVRDGKLDLIFLKEIT